LKVGDEGTDAADTLAESAKIRVYQKENSQESHYYL